MAVLPTPNLVTFQDVNGKQYTIELQLSQDGTGSYVASAYVTGDYLQQIYALLQAQQEPLGMNKLPLTLNLPLRPDMNLLTPT